jgi:hypothetical protein
MRAGHLCCGSCNNAALMHNASACKTEMCFTSQRCVLPWGHHAAAFCRPAVVLSYIVASVAAILSAFCYTEFAVDLPVAGGAFVYVNSVFGELIGWCAQPSSLPCTSTAAHAAALCWCTLHTRPLPAEVAYFSCTDTQEAATLLLDMLAWRVLDSCNRACRIGASNLLLEYTLSAAAVARSFTSYTGALINGDADLLRIATGSKYFLVDFPALGVIIALCALLAIGTQGGFRFNTAITILNLVIIGFVFAAGVPHFKASNFKPFLPLGVQGIFSGASKVRTPSGLWASYVHACARQVVWAICRAHRAQLIHAQVVARRNRQTLHPGAGLLLVHRLRHRVHRGRGDEGPGEGPAHRHRRVPARLRGPLRRDVRHDLRHGALERDRQQRAVRDRV